MSTVPESMVLLQVPHIPRVQEDGRRKPAARAALRLVCGPHQDTPALGEFDAETAMGALPPQERPPRIRRANSPKGSSPDDSEHVKSRLVQHRRDSGHERSRAAAENSRSAHGGVNSMARQASDEDGPLVLTDSRFAIWARRSRGDCRPSLQLWRKMMSAGVRAGVDENNVAVIGKSTDVRPSTERGNPLTPDSSSISERRRRRGK